MGAMAPKEKDMKIKQLFIGTDHGGYRIKEVLKPWLEQQTGSRQAIVDKGALEFNPDDDYPLFGREVAEAIEAAAEPVDDDPTVFGLLLCRSGSGMAIVANRYPHVRAVVCRSVGDARHAREHNNGNVVVLEGDFLTDEEARAIVRTFLETKFGRGRHARRIKQIAAAGVRA